MTRPRKRRVSVTSTPGRSGPRAMGAHGDQAHLPAGEVGRLREEREDLLGGAADLRRVLEGGHRSGRSFRPDASGNRYGARGGAGRRNAARSPARRAGRRPRSRSTPARRWRCWPCSRSPTGRARATCSPSCCGPSTTPSTPAARCGGRCRRCARRSAPTRRRDARPASAWCAARGSTSTSTASARSPRRRRRRAPRRCSAASSSRASGCATRPGSRTGSAARPTRCGASSRPCWRGWSRRPATSRVAQRWLELDPLHEPAHRALIRLYAERGDRAAALAQYRECVRTLSRELGVPPLAETTRLYEAISEGTLEAPAATPRRRRSDPLPARRAARRARPRVGGAASAPTTASPRTAASCCWRARRGSARRAWPRSSSRTRASGAPRCSAGRAYEEEAALAYGPLVEALRRAAARRRRLGRRASPTARSCEAARLLPDLSARPSPAARRPRRPGALPRRRVGDARRRRGRAGARGCSSSTTCSGPTRRRSGCSAYGAAPARAAGACSCC